MHEMRVHTLKLVLEYDGTDFAGWQVQPDQRTVQGEIEDALARILGHPVRLTAAGRTDAGVHASGQVAGFKTTSDFGAGRLKRALNAVLPGDITVMEIDEVHDTFNARFDAKSRMYRYTLTDRKISVNRAYAWRVKYSLTRELLKEATRPLCGVCSLEGFSKKNDDDDYATIVYNNGWTFNENLMIFEVCAIRFFQHAVRTIVGTAVEVARGKESPDLIGRVLETGDRSLAGPLAPARGLCLVKVDYEEEKRPSFIHELSKLSNRRNH